MVVSIWFTFPFCPIYWRLRKPRIIAVDLHFALQTTVCIHIQDFIWYFGVNRYNYSQFTAGKTEGHKIEDLHPRLYWPASSLILQLKTVTFFFINIIKQFVLTFYFEFQLRYHMIVSMFNLKLLWSSTNVMFQIKK